MPPRFAPDPTTGFATIVPPVVGGSFAAAGPASTVFQAQRGDFSFTLRGTFTGSFQLERSTDRGASWVVVSASPGGGPATWTAAGLAVLSEAEDRAWYRVRCTALSAGTAIWRLGQ